jgi:hypothetical protein
MSNGVQKGKKVRMPDTIRGLERRPLWIITCYHNSRMEVLTVDPDGDDGGSLPVFSFQEKAQEFLSLSENDQEAEERRWRSRETTAGELVSVLLAPCADVRQVALDPLPLTLGMGRLMASLCSIARERFVEELLGRRREAAEELVPA